jgi:hypothetical protein
MSGGGGSVTLTTSLPIPSGKPKSDEGEEEEIVGVDVIAVHPGVRMAVNRRVKKTNINFFMTVSSFHLVFIHE